MADQQQALGAALAGMTSHDMARAPRRLHVDPLDLEPQRLELGAQHLTDRGNAGEVQRPAVLIDPFFEHRERARPLCIDRAHHHLFGG